MHLVRKTRPLPGPLSSIGGKIHVFGQFERWDRGGIIVVVIYGRNGDVSFFAVVVVFVEERFLMAKKNRPKRILNC